MNTTADMQPQNVTNPPKRLRFLIDASILKSYALFLSYCIHTLMTMPHHSFTAEGKNVSLKMISYEPWTEND